MKNSEMSNFGVVSTVTAPTLKSVKQTDLIQFETEYMAYKEKIADINRTQGYDHEVAPASIRNCVDPMLLHSLCILRQIGGATTVEEATDAAVKNWFETRLRSRSTY